MPGHVNLGFQWPSGIDIDDCYLRGLRKVGDRNRGRPEPSLFYSYYTIDETGSGYF